MLARTSRKGAMGTKEQTCGQKLERNRARELRHVGGGWIPAQGDGPRRLKEANSIAFARYDVYKLHRQTALP